ncbi:TadE/TadG family type IV pilus assembly protein [Streptomyces violascens]|uniref:TadE/TadG family type IV pilus assembly protein n=1 Tax=Streptomyces violascens TaxID=67381 RepID=UPI0036934A76
MTLHRLLRDDRGSTALTTAIAAPAVLALLALIIAAGRVTLAQGGADAAARAAARTASLTRDPTTADAQARAAAQQALDNSGLHCTQMTVALDTSGLAMPVGQAATVTATVTCTAPLSDLALPGIPGAKTLTGTMTSIVDQWRAKAPRSTS